jgi:hypothetical protein
LASWQLGIGVCRSALVFDWANRATAGFSAAEEAVIDASFNLWATVLPAPESRTVSLTIGREPLGDALGLLIRSATPMERLS